MEKGMIDKKITIEENSFGNTKPIVLQMPNITLGQNEPLVSPKTADDSNKIRWFMELALKMREIGYSDASIYSIDTDAWDEYRVDDELTPEQAITEEESNG